MIHRYEIRDVYLKGVGDDIKKERLWDYDSIYLEAEAFTFNLANTLKTAIGVFKKWKITPVTIVFNNLIIIYLFFGRLKIYNNQLIEKIFELV